MKNFTKCMCVIDACSIINLDNITLAHNDVLFYSRKYFNVQVCDIIKKEIKRHANLIESKEGSFWPPFLSNKTYLPEKLKDDKKTLIHFYSKPPKSFDSESAGERGNARISLELLLTGKVGHVIFLTDDENARNAFLKDLSKSFPGCKLWSSFDLILYLGSQLMKQKKSTWDDVFSALRDVLATNSKRRKLGDYTSEAISDIKKYKKLLNKIQMVTNQWR